MADQQVLGLDVAVDDVLGVAVAQGVRHFLHVLGGTSLTAQQKIEKALRQGWYCSRETRDLESSIHFLQA